MVSPDGKKIAYLGFDDRLQGYQVTHLYVMDLDGKNSRLVTGSFDRDVDGSAVVSQQPRGVLLL